MIRVKKQPKSREQEDEALQLWGPPARVCTPSSTILNTEKGHDGPLLEIEASSVLGAILSDWMFIHCFHLSCTNREVSSLLLPLASKVIHVKRGSVLWSKSPTNGTYKMNSKGQSFGA